MRPVCRQRRCRGSGPADQSDEVGGIDGHRNTQAIRWLVVSVFAFAFNLALLWLLHGAMQGDAEAHRGVRRGQFRSLTLRASQPLTTHVDGELFLRSEQGVHDCQIDVLPGELAVLAPRGPA